VITLDTSAVVALVNRSDVCHGDAARALADHGGPTVVPLAILAEVAEVLDDRLGSIATVGFLRGLEQGDSLLDCGDADVPRIRELMASAFKHLRTLDVLVKNELAGDRSLQSVWKRARRVEDTRRTRTAPPAPETPVAPTDADKAA